MHPLRIYLFGSLRVVDGGHTQTELTLTHQVQALLAYLLLSPHRLHPRDVLSNLAWGHRPAAQARRCLNTTLYRLRRALEPAGVVRGAYLLTTATDDVGFNWLSAHWLDIEIFEREVRRVLPQPVETVPAAAAQTLADALQLYAGDLLEGFYDDWALAERERLRTLYLNGLAYLMDYYHWHGAYGESLAYGERILHLEPLREEMHREVMRLYLRMGLRALAVRQYERCRQLLTAELGIPPMAETQALYAQALGQASAPAQRPPVTETAPALPPVWAQLERALQALDAARAQLERAVPAVASLPRAGDGSC